MARIREKSKATLSVECRANTESAFLVITYPLAATANMTSDDVDQMVKIELCGNVIDEINVLIRDFKSKAYKDFLPAPSREGEQNESDDEK